MKTKKTDWQKANFTITNTGKPPFTITAVGRVLWALQCLKLAGPKGCTPIDNPGPRWSGYVHSLRSMGLEIETIHEAHGGAFSGNHARYVLHSAVSLPAAAGGAQ